MGTRGQRENGGTCFCQWLQKRKTQICKHNEPNLRHPSYPAASFWSHTSPTLASLPVAPAFWSLEKRFASLRFLSPPGHRGAAEEQQALGEAHRGARVPGGQEWGALTWKLSRIKLFRGVQVRSKVVGEFVWTTSGGSSQLLLVKSLLGDPWRGDQNWWVSLF